MSPDSEAFVLKEISQIASGPQPAVRITADQARTYLASLITQVDFHQVLMGVTRWDPLEQSIYMMPIGQVVTLIERYAEELKSLKATEKQRTVMTPDMEVRVAKVMEALGSKS